MIKTNLDLKDTRFKINSNYKKELFTILLKIYGRKILSTKLKISSSMIYHYRNNHTNNISADLFYRSLNLANIKNEEGKKFIEKVYSLNEDIKLILKEGSKKRHRQLKLFREQIPKVTKIISDNQLNVRKWFDRYKNLLEIGARTINKVEENNESILIYHTNYVKGKKENFKVILPKYIILDNDFCYFFGLWCGDRAGGGRLGVLNTENEINKFTKYYLEKLNQKIQVVILKSSLVKKLPNLNIKYDKIQEVKGMSGTFVPMIFTVNGILKKFFDYLEKDLEIFINLLPNQLAFFGGLFDAEGNVFLEDKCFRWACKNERRTKIYINNLKEMKMYKRFDGGNIVCSNWQEFGKSILPYLKHPQKINDSNLICFNKGFLNKKFLNILKVVHDNNGANLKDLAKVLKRVRVNSQIKVLERLNYVESQDYPKKIYITRKGLAEHRARGEGK